NSSVYIRIPFEVDDPADITQLTLNMMYDDGFMAYLNGQRIASANSQPLVSWSTAASAQHDDAAALQFETFSVANAGVEALRRGTNMLAIQGFNFTIDSSDLLIVPILSASSTTEGEAIVLTEPTQIKTRAKLGNEWSGLAEATFVYNSDLPLRITELMYHPARPQTAGEYSADDFEFIEIQNVGATPASLAGVYFDNGVQFNFTSSAIQTLGPGEYLVLVENLEAFSMIYETEGLNIAGQYGGNLDNGGERISLTDGRGEKILEFRYEDDWFVESDGGGHSLNIIDPSGNTESWNDEAGWALSAKPGGTPGSPGGGDFVPSGWQFPGDANQDGVLDISDPVRLLRQLYLGVPGEILCDSENLASGGSLVVLDVNGDSMADLSDAVYSLNYLFTRGPGPVLGSECVRVEGCPSSCR
ncbi:MAG: lamin tail domain-containing protein, partial [Planctomycetota bacterium]|nr:lamin tail domain-containing protein [Planctomycetota bacterium]